MNSRKGKSSLARAVKLAGWSQEGFQRGVWVVERGCWQWGLEASAAPLHLKPSPFLKQD